MMINVNGAAVFSNDRFVRENYSFSVDSANTDCASVDGSDIYVLPGFADVHVHFREPGFSYKETIKSGSMAGSRGGFTTVCTMPNLNPTPDSLDNLKIQLDIIKRDSKIRVVPFGSITVGEQGKMLSDLVAMAPYVCGFSDDGRGVDDEGLMREAMTIAALHGKVISAHCEDGTAIKDSPEAEWKEIERDIKLASDTGCKFHVCHISTKESVSLIRDAKKSGVDITCETAPHYLVFSDNDVIDDGRFKMNPPIRTAVDRNALIEGVCDCTIDMIATDHAPHSAEEKSKGFVGSLNGIVGLETSFPVMYTHLCKTGILSLERLVDMMSVAPHKRFGLVQNGYCVVDLNKQFKVDPNKFLTMGRSCPFTGMDLFGEVVATVIDSEVVYFNGSF